MKISKKKVDDQNLVLTLSIAAADYAEKQKKELSELRRKAEIKGFRKGMVPASLINRMYGQQVLVNSVQDTISESLNDYITKNKLKVIGEPLPVEGADKNEWVSGNDFEFKFDVALYPEINFELTKDDEVVYYTITSTAEAKAEMKSNLLKQYGSLVDGEAAKEEDFIIADFENGDNKVEGTYVALRNVAEAVRPAFVGIKAGDELNVNVNEAFENETDRASMLKLSKEELAALAPEWKMTVKNVKTFADAPMTTETFDKIFGEGVVADEAAFDAKIEERLKAEYTNEADFRLQKDMKDYLIGKAAMTLPEKFLKRWLFVATEAKFTQEEIDNEFPMFLEDFKWQLIRDYILEKCKVEIKEEDVLASAKAFAAYQYAMYGMNNVPDEQLESLAKSILSQEKDSRRILEQVETEKAVAAARELVTLKKKKISVKNFRELK
ncbi:MAG: hypothetical protein MJY56_07140 [Bacteroidales bacterium]|nr:hypothetical protein [Bacteroidales bacterium]